MSTETNQNDDEIEIINEEVEKIDQEILSPGKDETVTGVDDSSCHLLEGRWTFWFTHRPTTFRNSSVNYDSCLKKLGEFDFLSTFRQTMFLFHSRHSRVIRFDRRILVLLRSYEVSW